MHGISGWSNSHNVMNDEYMNTRQKLTNGLKELWNKYNSNIEGDSATKIDKNEMLSTTGSIFFVEEGMTEQEFMQKNYEVYEAYASGENSKRTTVVSKLVKEMIENGQFESKRDVILGKLDYLDAETRMLVEQEEDTYKTCQETLKDLESYNKEETEKQNIQFGLSE